MITRQPTKCKKGEVSWKIENKTTKAKEAPGKAQSTKDTTKSIIQTRNPATTKSGGNPTLPLKKHTHIYIHKHTYILGLET